MRSTMILLLFAQLSLMAEPAEAVILDVFPDGSGTYPGIQQALMAVQAGDTIRLADGTFTGPDNRNLMLGGDFTNCAASADPTACVIDIEQQGRAFLINSMPSATICIDGITIRGGDSRFLSVPEMPGNGGAIFQDCTIRNNLATDGAGIYVGFCNTFGEVEFYNCVFYANDYPEPSVGGYGTGIYFSHSTGIVASCTLVDNRAWIGGGILVSTDSNVQVHRSIIAFSPEGQGLAVHNGTVQVDYTDIHGNAGGDWVGVIENLHGVDCNIEVDPLFCSTVEEDFTLREDSPCLSENSAGCGLIGALPSGCPEPSAVENGWIASERNVLLVPGYPNPFNPTVNLSFFLPDPGQANLRIFDLAGGCVRTLVAGETSAGWHCLIWRGNDDRGRSLASGVYLLQLEYGSIVQSRRLALVR